MNDEQAGGDTVIEVDRNDLTHTRIVAEDVAVGTGAVLAVEHFALTANNVTYAAYGAALNYWGFFPAQPASDTEWGRVPVWGFATVVDAGDTDLVAGSSVYGYLPMATSVRVEPGRISDAGFTDLAAHRQPMAAAYNGYVAPGADPAYEAGREAQQMVLWPLFFTSFVIDDLLAEESMFGADQVVISSASSKTAIGSARLLSARGVDVIGLTSAANADFVRSLGCYSTTIDYDSVDQLDRAPSVYVDIAGNGSVRAAVHRHLEPLRYSMTVGGAHWEAIASGEALVGPEPVMLFAPSQIAKRTAEWGRDELNRRVGDAWRSYSAWTDAWLRIERIHGAEAVRSAFARLVAGDVGPDEGLVCSLRTVS